MATKFLPEPWKLPATKSGEAWAYEDGRGVEVYIEVPGRGPVSVHIPKRLLEAYVKRARAVKRKKRATT